MINRFALWCGFLVLLLGVARFVEQPAAAAEPYDLSTASFLGDGGDGDAVRGARIQSSGIIVLAANIGSAQPGGVTPLLLNGAAAGSSGAVIRLTPDGQTVLSVTRVAATVTDLSIDDDDNIVVALWNDGVIKLDPEATSVTWVKNPGRVLRVDAGDNGEIAALVTPTSDPDASSPGTGTIFLYSDAGAELDNFSGKHNTLDVCLDSSSQTVIHIGWRQASVSGTPVQIAYLQGHAFNGNTQWTAYDWSTDSGSPRFINSSTNNMADTRGYRCDVGADERLYAAFEAAGGNHIFRFDPFDIDSSISIVGGDAFHEFFNSGAEHKTFFARFEPATGEYLKGQQLTARLTSGKANTVRIRHGAITADHQGRVYLGGSSAFGLPLPGHPQFSTQPGQIAFLPPNTGTYLGGAWLLVMDQQFEKRLYLTRLTPGGSARAVDGRVLEGNEANIVFAGHSSNFGETHILNALQPAAGGGDQDGFLGVIAPITEVLGIVRARFTADQTVGLAPLTVNFDAGGTTTQNNAITSYEWNFGDGNSSSGSEAAHTFTTPGLYTVTLTATDDQNESATAEIEILAAAAQVMMPVVTR
ncbi:MAG: PKD domain-containing protein [Ardenticatenaceae bacterium]|nr:PKD domain-containing protein [Ardenticatenaceae bacterium]